MENNTKLVKRLQSFSDKNAAAKAIFTWLASRDNNSAETTVDRIYNKMDADIERTDLVDILKEFENMGLGKFISGRRGLKSRFAWSYDLIQVGKAALGQVATLTESPLVDPHADDAPQTAPATAAPAKSTSAAIGEFPASGNGHMQPVNITIMLPVQMTPAQSKTLADILRTVGVGVQVSA